MVGEGGRCMPTQEEVVKKTEKITRALQGLFQLAQDSKHEMCVAFFMTMDIFTMMNVIIIVVVVVVVMSIF